MADFVLAVDPGGNKRRVPAHYLENPALTDQGFKLPPSTRKKAKEPAATSGAERVEEPAATSTATTTVTEPAAAGEK
jgi:hypothetical protein